MMDGPDTRTDMGGDPAPVTWARLLEDWVTIWQSEMAALAVDREVQEATVRAADAWAAQARAAAGVWAPVLQAADERARGRAGADAPAGTAAAAAAPDERDAAIGQLLQRVAELERRLGPRCPAAGG